MKQIENLTLQLGEAERTLAEKNEDMESLDKNSKDEVRQLYLYKKINAKPREIMLKMGAILFWTDMMHLFNWNIEHFKVSFHSRGQLGS